MRIVIDLQSSQGTSKDRGIGRYSLSLALAMAKLGTDHEIWIALNASLPDTIEPLRRAFGAMVPQERIVVWQAPGPVAGRDPANKQRRGTAELLRESFLAGLNPDLVWVPSLVEGWMDDSVTSVGEGPERVFTAVTLYDLIPLIYPGMYLGECSNQAWYYRKLQHIRNADLWLTISEHTRQDAVERLGLPEDQLINVSAGHGPEFRPIQVNPEAEASLRRRYGLTRHFILYTGGIDPRKNVEGLIKAYGYLPRALRDAQQLVIVCDIQEHNRRRLAELSRREDLRPDDVVFTGFVPDDDLALLYNLCTLFVFPSLYEGFGLPPLEAMACGAPVIASHASSIPEVVGWEQALFDPKKPEAVAEKMQEALTDRRFHEALKTHGLEQAKRFSWEKSAKRVLSAFDAFHTEQMRGNQSSVPQRIGKMTLAYVSPLPPARTGIADYSRDLLPELARYYRIELIVDQSEVSDPWLTANFPIRTAEWFDAHADRYDRKLYQFGNSEFHKHMFELLESHPGVVVLHDLYLSNVLRWMDGTGYAPGVFRRELYRAHGYRAVAELSERNGEIVSWQYPCSLSVFDGADGVIVHSRHAMELAEKWYGHHVLQKLRFMPSVRRMPASLKRDAARARLGLRDDDYMVCSFGLFLGPTRLPDRLLEAWSGSLLAKDPRCRLVFVGAAPDVVDSYRKQTSTFSGADQVYGTGYVHEDLYQAYLAAADAAVQLRTRSRGETSRSVLDCLAYGVPLVVNAHGAEAERPSSVVVKLEDGFEVGELTAALERLHQDPELRKALREAARSHFQQLHTPFKGAVHCRDAIEHFADVGPHARRRRLVRALADDESRRPQPGKELATTAVALAMNASQLEERGRQLLVDISVLACGDLGTGIERTTRAIVQTLLAAPVQGFRVEPIKAVSRRGYCYAREFTCRMLGIPILPLPDDPVEVLRGDVFLGLNWAPHAALNNRDYFRMLRNQGGEAYFIVYDLLPLLHSENFPRELAPTFEQWLKLIVNMGDGAICISRAVADNLVDWLEVQGERCDHPFRVGYFHLGADIEASLTSSGRTPGQAAVLESMRARPTFLVVGTIGPGKGHAQAAAAFERLWRARADVGLVLAGRRSSLEGLPTQLRRHPEFRKRIWWVDGPSDEELLRLYQDASALIMASEGEGFGLPLVEAARCRLPIIARDVPVTREICGEHALYFSGSEPQDLADAVMEWLRLDEEGKAPSVQGMKWLTWEESTRQLLDVILEDRWYKTWEPK